DRLFDQPLNAYNTPQQFWLGGGWPAVDLHEDRDKLVVKIEVPGMKKEDIDISLHDGVLAISGERKSEEKYEKAETHRSERFVGRFSRALSLPVSVQADKTSANYQDGILTVTLPKAEEAKPKQIHVQAE
ncbi:MAG TPA: Hsp20/alpha crystallin family protein, partial [Verrucomicrobiae bacterium]|nr:Hsp20/alpha crystallin family protein [Verrucomicrobiae bacterium]